MQTKPVEVLFGRRENLFYFCDFLFLAPPKGKDAYISVYTPLTVDHSAVVSEEGVSLLYEDEIRKEGFPEQMYPTISKVKALPLSEMSEDEFDFEVVYDPYFFAQLLELKG